ncbi:MAG: isoprenylcysteine carboxyl methyltransferase [Actinomycetia bacterium]|nr:isoprenylcysteine carboxyl methyltransferase [Actinomycetes bacterium]
MVGLALFVGYVAVALVWRMAEHRHRSGDGKGRLTATSPLGRLASAVIVLGHVVTLVATFGADTHVGPAIVGTVVVAAGLALVVRAQVAMGDSWRVSVDPEEVTGLVTRDVFGVVRNPIFSGMVVCLVGIALAASSWLAAVGAIVFVLGIEVEVRLVEEPYLQRTHGAAFAEYRRRTGRFLPRPRAATA